MSSNSEYSREWRKTHQEESRAIKRRQYQKLRKAAIDVLGGKCVRCGFDDPRALQVDHIDGGGRKHAKEVTVMKRWRNLRDGDIEGYQLLCANCNWIKRVENEEFK